MVSQTDMCVVRMSQTGDGHCARHSMEGWSNVDTRDAAIREKIPTLAGMTCTWPDQDQAFDEWDFDCNPETVRIIRTPATVNLKPQSGTLTAAVALEAGMGYVSE